jgi:response regulator RpfG family c-di-GMP phosphodiesterase
MAGYEQVISLVEKDENIDDLHFIITTAVSDSNQVAQEAGLALVVAYLSKNSDHS